MSTLPHAISRCIALHQQAWLHMNIKVAIIALYIAELNGIEMAITRLQSNHGKKMVVFSDCQAAIRAVQNPKRSSGQYVVASIYDHIRVLPPAAAQYTPRPSDLVPVKINWIPARLGMPGVAQIVGHNTARLKMLHGRHS